MRISGVALITLATLVLPGCKRSQIRVYQAPRDMAPEAVAAAAASGEEAPKITWTLPAGWKEVPPGQMSLAAFAVTDAAGQATTNITPLPNLKGQEEAVVNMWREQVGLGPMPQEEIVKAFQPTEIGGEPGQSFEINGTREGKPVRTVTAVVHREDQSWFFKISGDDATVTAQKPSFFEFLKGVRIARQTGTPSSPSPSGGARSAPPAPAPVGDGMASFRWTVPAAWTTLAPGQMQVAKFSVPEKDGTKAEVSVSVFPSDTGGALANINRWRRQIGLGDIDEAGLQSCTAGIPNTTGGVLVTLTNEQRQMLGAIVPREGRWWFYKMLGDLPAVASAKDDFVRFVQTAP